jgi:hypothetical protein
VNSTFRVTAILLAVLALCSGARAEDLPPCKNHYILSEECKLAEPVLEWEVLPDSLFSHARNHTAVLLADGRLLVLGGASYTYDPVTRTWLRVEPFGAEIYDPSTREWRATSPMLESRLDSFHAVRLLDGRVLVLDPGAVDGYDPGTAQIFDPARDTWTATGTLNTPRGGFSMTLLPNGKVLAAGGVDRWDRVLGSAEIWDPETGAWRPTGALIERRTGHSATSLPDGRILVVAGVNDDYVLAWSTGSAELFDPATETWSSAGAIENRSFGHSATLTEDGEVLVAGGYFDLQSRPDSRFGNHFFVPRMRASASIYNIAEGSWRSVGNLNAERFKHMAVPLSGFGVLVFGSDQILPPKYLPSVLPQERPEILARDSNSWRYIDAVNALPMPAANYHSATTLNDGTVIFIGEGRSAALLKYR